jgi:farnesol dehydrogenase
MKVVVTGGTGFLGSHLVDRLLKQGKEVSVVSRSAGHDICLREGLDTPFENAEVAFHLAARVKSRAGDFYGTNVDGLRNVLEVCQDSGIKKLIYVSSFTVFGPSNGHPHTEDTREQRTDFFHGYDRSKYDGLQLIQEWKTRLDISVVYPTVIFGPGPLTEGNILIRLLQRWQQLHVAPLPNKGKPSWNFVFVDDVAKGILKVAGAGSGEDFILGGEDCSLLDLCHNYREAAGTKILPVGLSPSIFKASAYLEDLISRLGGFPPLVLPNTSDFFLQDWQFSSKKARSQLEYAPRSLVTGLKETHRWMQQQNIV